jgi:hypothetical protein
MTGRSVDDPAPAGWTKDKDDWFWRSLRPSDPDLWEMGASALGFTTDSRIYVRLPAYALAVDAGKPIREWDYG